MAKISQYPRITTFTGTELFVLDTGDEEHRRTVTTTSADLFAAFAGGGTVTSVGISSTDLTVSGSPITHSGIIGLAIATGAVTDQKSSLADKPSVDRVTTTNQASLSGLPTVDGVAMTDEQVLMCTGQSTASQNGPWVVHAGVWARPNWYVSGNTAQAFLGVTIEVADGDFYAGSIWRLTTSGVITIDTTGTAWSAIAKRFDIATFFPGAPANSQTLLRYVAARVIRFGAGAPSSQLSAGTAATGSATVSIKKNGSTAGTITVSPSGTTGSFTVGSTISLVAGDVLTIVGPSSADATLADIAITLAGTA
jgi:hypothetical protein